MMTTRRIYPTDRPAHPRHLMKKNGSIAIPARKILETLLLELDLVRGE